ncbi:MAG: DNA-binding protein [Evtepia sp.]|uniref:DNA-binding protein n=1 Tax=Evtepia sp. TaxID=2773933 RepID=UPI002A7646DC|nr:DNA-binding protein [Evtepia sp.]MDY3015490.1 DNA-binding protein [Evtepia sp.]
MASNTFMRVEEVAETLGISKSYAYKIVQKLNAELKDKGFLTIAGRVNKQYFMEKTCYGAAESKERK